jgi:hypothetical protein
VIDCPGLTSAFFEEARLFAERMRFNEESHTEGSDTEEKFARLMASSPLPSSAQLCSVIEEVFWASLLTEEGRPCRPRLLYSPGREQVRPSVHQLARSVPLTRETLRKLAPVQGSLGYLAWDYGSGGMEITGVQGREGGDPGNLIIAAPKNGALDISWSCARLLALRAGQLARLSQSRLPEVLRALEFVGRLTGSIEPAFLGSVIRAIASAGHGISGYFAA